MAKSTKSRSRSAAVAVEVEPVTPNSPSVERERMIAEAAYFRALSRGFEGGDPSDDWFAAERELDQTS